MKLTAFSAAHFCPQTLGGPQASGRPLQDSTSKGASLLPVVLLTSSVVCLCLVVLFILPRPADAQVAINLDVQEIYDDNIFLEDDEDRPAFLVVDDLLEQDVKRGELRTVLNEQNDGDPNDDLITNISVSLAGTVPLFPELIETNAQGTVGFILFADNDSNNRLTLNGAIETKAARTWLPQPYFIELVNQFISTSADSTVAGGTASRTTNYYRLIGRAGVRGVDIAPRTTWGLGYTGTYNVFLGELRFEDPAPGEFEEEGTDYHSHFAGTDLNYQITEALTISLLGDAGVQLYTSTDTNDPDFDTRQEDDLDRTEYGGRVRLSYQAAEKIALGSYVGVQHSDFRNDVEPIEVTIFDKENRPRTVIREREDSETSLVFGADASYTFSPGTQVLAGIDQDVGTDIDGDRITTRTIFANGAYALNDRLSFNVGGRFYQFSSSDELDNAVDRYEASSSLSYLLTQQTALTLGYNFVTQESSDEDAELTAFSRSQDYESNRIFIGINVGFLGLPL